MIIEIGHFALILALGVALLQMVVPAWGAHKGDVRFMEMGSISAVTQLFLLSISFFALTHAYLTSDFSVQNVWENSHSTKPFIYKLSGVWGNHEGSMLLWVLILALCGAAVAVFGNNLPLQLKANVLAVQASIALSFLLFIIFTSNPFERLPNEQIQLLPTDGRGLNPLLQDPALAIHPPLLYIGYVGFSIAFSFAVAALIDGRVDAAWARWVRPWTLAAWMFLTVGISIGSWWAYYELGWGGWWFWDPVENASFMPWLLGTALLHSALVMEKRDTLKVWTILLAILTFSLSLMGTFLVRSGVLTSVHAFAVDPERGIFILGIMIFFTGGALTLFAWRSQLLKSGGLFAPISREGALVLNNVLLTVSCGVVFIGTLYPLFYEALTGQKISVGPPFFNMTFGPLMIPLLLALPFGPFLAWKRGDLAGAAQRMYFAIGIAGFFTIMIFAFTYQGPWLAPIGLGLGIWLIAGAINEILFRIKAFSVSRAEALRRLVNLPRSTIGTAVAHTGVGIMVIGIVGISAWQSEKILFMKKGDVVEIAGYEVQFNGVTQRTGPNYNEIVGALQVRQGGVVVADLFPSKRSYPVERDVTTEAGIHPTWGGDLFAVLGENSTNEKATVRVYFNPLVRLIWYGTFVMFLGGLISLSDRRLRVGAPRKAELKSTGAVPAAAE